MPDFTDRGSTDRDSTHRDSTPRGWPEAFAALPLEDAPAGGWDAIARTLDQTNRTTAPRVRRHRRGWVLPVALAAGLLLAVVGAWFPRQVLETSRVATTPARALPRNATNPGNELERLYAESARLEMLVGYARDPRVASGAAAALSADLEGRVASIDAALMQPDLGPQRQAALWRDRVQALQSLAAFESNRRWLAAQGKHYDGALARVD
jgi:hypothetical protein